MSNDTQPRDDADATSISATTKDAENPAQTTDASAGGSDAAEPAPQASAQAPGDDAGASEPEGGQGVLPGAAEQPSDGESAAVAPEPSAEPADAATSRDDPSVYVPGQATKCPLNDEGGTFLQLQAGDVCLLLQRIERHLPADTNAPGTDAERRTVRLCNALRAAIGYGPVDHPEV